MTEQELQLNRLKQMADTMKLWSQPSDQNLLGEIEYVSLQYQSRLSQFKPAADGSGYSSQTLAFYVATLIEIENRLNRFDLQIKPGDLGKTDTASQRFVTMRQELRLNLKEAAYMTPFKSVLEQFWAYVMSLPSALPANANAAALEAASNRFAEFGQVLHTFEAHVSELELQGRPAFRKWLTYALAGLQTQITTIQKRQADLQNVSQFVSQEATYLAQLNSLYQAFIACQNNPNPNSTLESHLSELRTIDMRMSGYENVANDLQSRQLPSVRQRLTAARTEVQAAINKIAGMIQSSQYAYNQAAQQIALQSNKDIMDVMQRMHDKQVGMYDVIAKMNGH
jgi:hypothetical protein